ncbi:hypothetical protein L195_g020104 [Trifolium pratense]|uniref:Uncharacterized protein n=1 Tax=Trifolium pratense TaxID=57577 RepID=A0A2K3N1I0_TRIPR|nr:hypothetical protein L195_g020104 [Trifolium pratense]
MDAPHNSHVDAKPDIMPKIVDPPADVKLDITAISSARGCIILAAMSDFALAGE